MDSRGRHRLAYFSLAVPWPPLMMAPAWPMRRPGGAVCPAINPATGLRTLRLIYAAAVSSALPPISPIITMACVSGSSLKRRMESRNDVPMIGIAANADAGGLPNSKRGKLRYGFIRQRSAAADDVPRFRLCELRPGMMPILHLPGEIIPGQFGPIRRVFPSRSTAATRTMSSVGMPSVMHTTSGRRRRRLPESRPPQTAAGQKSATHSRLVSSAPPPPRY